MWKTGDAQALDVESNSFDAIVTRNVTWNLPRPDLAYKEWLRVLKPGGVLYNLMQTGMDIYIMKRNAADTRRIVSRQKSRM